MNARKLVIGLVLTASPAGLAGFMGCASTSSATSSTVSYIRGDQRATLGATPPQITSATLAAGDELELHLDSHASDGLVGDVVLHTSDGTKVEVSIKARENDQSDIDIRVGTFGDKVLQARILEKIKAHLASGVSAPVVATPVAPAPMPMRMQPAPAQAPAPVMSAPPANPLSPAPGNPLSPTTMP